MESSLKTQSFIKACIRGPHAMMFPLGNPVRGQHREGHK